VVEFIDAPEAFDAYPMCVTHGWRQRVSTARAADSKGPRKNTSLLTFYPGESATVLYRKFCGN
jgi:hypothetical protein